MKNFSDLYGFFENKEVVLVGPGLGAKDDLEKLLEEKDLSKAIFVGLNSHYKIQSYFNPSVLFHHLNPDSYSKSEVDEWKKNGIKIVSRDDLQEKNFSMKIRTYKNTNLNEYDYTYKVNHKDFLEIRKLYDSSPSTGTLAIHYLLQSKLKELNIVGVDFYDTFYEYNNNSYLAKNVRESGHKSKSQFKIFKKIFKDEKRIFYTGNLKKKMLD